MSDRIEDKDWSVPRVFCHRRMRETRSGKRESIRTGCDAAMLSAAHRKAHLHSTHDTRQNGQREREEEAHSMRKRHPGWKGGGLQHSVELAAMRM